jgi:DNA repair exonuclease SbcCD ATPase subunit
LEISNNQKEKIKILNENKDDIGNLKKLKNNKSDILKKINNLNQKIFEESKILGILTQKKEHQKTKIEKYNETQKLYEKYKIYCDLVGKNGIPTKMLNKFIPAIQENVNKILSDLYDFSIEFSIDNDEIEIYIDKGNGKNSALLASCAERFIINICIRIVLCKNSVTPKADIIIIDEMLANLDNNNKNSIGTFFDYLKNEFSSVIIISHLPELKSAVDQTITINKLTDGTSELSNIDDIDDIFNKISKKIVGRMKNIR